MSRVKFILFWLGTFCIANLAFAQQETKPVQCTSPGGGILVGGDFSLNPEFGCLNSTNNVAVINILNPQANNGATLVGGNYIFNLRDGRDITKNVSTRPDTTVTSPGIYWVMQLGNTGGEIYVTCKSFEVIKTEKPDIEVNSCGTDRITLTFRKSAINDKHSGYKIIWGDGSPDDIFQSLTPSSFPFTTPPHIYTGTPSVQPLVIANYAKGCSSEPLQFQLSANNMPVITELEGLTGGTSNKITMTEGIIGVPYTIEQQPKNGTWTDTGKKITRNTGENSKSETVTGLNAATEYCFRLKTIDGCGNPIYSSIEGVCTIIPKITVVAPKEVKIDWNTPAPTVTRYVLNYSESPTGASPNTTFIPPPTTTFLFNAPNCLTKYNFQITAEITVATNFVKVKSPTILVDPASSVLLEPITIGKVSVVNNAIEFRPFVTNPAANYIFYRSDSNANNFVEVGQSPNNNYDDGDVEPNKQQYCYKIAYQDECRNTSPQSPAFCSVFLTSSQTSTLNWTKFVIPSPSTFPAEYYIESIDESGSSNSVDFTLDNNLNVKGQIEILLNLPSSTGQAKFRIRAVQKMVINSVTFPFEVLSNEYVFVSTAEIYVPTAFSPNADGKNDIFEAKGKYIDEFNLEIFDRWGNVIFESNDLNVGWAGTTNDGISLAPSGSYSFRIYGLDTAGQKFEKTGSISLLR